MKFINKVKDTFKLIFGVVKKVLPFDDNMEMHTVFYSIKKLLAFCMLYFLSAMLILEPVVIAVTQLAGYDPLHGVMPAPDSLLGEPLKYIGFFGFIVLTVIYCKVVEKRGPKAMGINKKLSDYLLGSIAALGMLAVTVGICTATGIMSFAGTNNSLDKTYTLIMIVGLVIQGASEEIMCRGFVFTSLIRKTSVPVAIFVSATAFYIPHYFTIKDSEPIYAIIATLNIYLISAIFSLLMYHRGNIWVACGLHSVWNILLYAVMGLNLSGSEAGDIGVFIFNVKAENIFFGGAYGLEAGLTVTFVLAAVLTVLILFGRRKEKKNEIQQQTLRTQKEQGFVTRGTGEQA